MILDKHLVVFLKDEKKIEKVKKIPGIFWLFQSTKNPRSLNKKISFY
jgi:hypothetical protein